MDNFLTNKDKDIVNRICQKIVPGIFGVEDRLETVLLSLNSYVRFAWLFYLRNFAAKISLYDELKLRKEAYKSPLKEFLLPIRYAAFSDMIEEKEVPQVKQERWQQQIVDGSFVTSSIDCDYVVVGSGAGGASVAYQLAAKGHAVLIIEEGNYYNRSNITGNPVDAFKKLYRNSGFTFAWSLNPFPVWAGKAVGGTTIINSGTCVRNSEYIIDQWVNKYNLGIFQNSIFNKYYSLAEEHLNVNLAEEKYIGNIGKLVKDASNNLGWKNGSLPRNSIGCDGQARCCFGCPTEAKTSTNVSFIPKALKAGAQLLTSAKVERIKFKDKTAVGCFVKTANGLININAEKGVILAGGALMNPQLLRDSDVVNEHIGAHLSIHPSIAVFASHYENINMTKEAIPQSYAVTEFLPEFMLEGAAMVPPIAAMAIKSVGVEFSELMLNYNKLSMFGALIKDTSKGFVLRDGHVLYSMNDKDLKTTAKAVSKLVKLLSNTKDVKEVFPFIKNIHKIGWDKVGLHNRNYIVNKLSNIKRITQSDITISAYHPLGSCRMGASPESSVVGEDFSVWKYKNLYIVDGSIFPDSTGHNPQLTIMAIGLMAGDLIGLN